MKVLSLFDGISGAQVALKRAGIKVDNYYASEVDKYAIQITQKNHPDTIQLGDVTQWLDWELPEIDLLVAGSPCQGFSLAGKQLNFDDHRSKLFFVFVDILRFIKPKYFLLENVKMKKEYQDVISDLVGVEPIEINSALLSAQNRRRLYWTNIPGIEQPEDKGLLLKDVIEDGAYCCQYNRKDGLKKEIDKACCLNSSDWRGLNRNQTQTAVVDRDKSHCLDANYFKGGNLKSYFEKHRRQLVFNRPCEPRDFKDNSIYHHATTALDIKGNESIKRVYAETGKSPTLTTMGGGHREPKILEPPIAFTERRTEEAKRIRREYMKEHGKDFSPRRAKELVARKDNKMNCLTATYSPKEHNILDEQLQYRKLSPLECERLQTFEDNYTEGVSNTQRYKALGNSFTVDVIAHILRGIK